LRPKSHNNSPSTSFEQVTHLRNPYRLVSDCLHTLDDETALAQRRNPFGGVNSNNTPSNHPGSLSLADT
ncbi:MAG TPA: hypothetical protein VL068_12855, partial [Microthrixaceae bacterium]|nr:hypothetical protein [Microthrixaceae bacterium]